MEAVGRFAPSPSGRMHLGNVCAALLAWLSVRSKGGKMVLRIEDLDPQRCKAEYANQLKRDLQWLGLDWDMEQTPQSLRTQAYTEAFVSLEKKGLVYPCYCSRSELHAASAPHAGDGQAVYAGICRGLSDAQRAEKSRAPAWRLKVPEDTITFCDGVQGLCAQDLARECGDFIIRRSDGVYAYQLAVVVDDAAAGVSEVVRGCDLLSSAPRQMYLQELLGFDHPQYYHVPLLVAPDGRRLSKRERDLDMQALRLRYTPQQLIGRLAHACGLIGHPQSISAQELAADFSWSRVRKENIVIENC